MFKNKSDTEIDIQATIQATKNINNELHKTYKISNLKDRIVFCACLLLYLQETKNINRYTNSSFSSTIILNWLKEQKEKQNDSKIASYYSFLTQKFANIEILDVSCAILSNTNKILNELDKMDCNTQTDVLAVLFNEFNHYNAVGSELGQVLTPDYVADLMAEIIDINNEDHILDATCGSGTFLMKAYNKNKTAHLFGIELDDTMYALSVINALINKASANIHLLQDDTLSKNSANFIKNAKINKVLMNPPYEFQYKPLEIVKNVLDNVAPNSVCAFLMPNNILKKANKDYLDELFSNHRLTKIIKLPKKVFANVGCGEVSIFVFLSSNAQNNLRAFGCCIEDDGLFTVKNQGRIDIEGNWKYDKKDY